MGRPKKYLIGLEKRKAKKEAKQVAPVVEKILPDTSKMSEEQIAKLVADFTKQDPFAIKGLNPSFRYRFLNRQADKLDRQTMRGWEIVTGPEAEKLAELNKIKTRQGQIIVGDAVLAKIPMQVFIALRAKLKALNDRVLGQHSAALRRDMGKKYSRNVEESLEIRDRGQKEQRVI